MTSETGFDPELYKRFPTKGRRPADELPTLQRIWCAPRGWGYITAVNNNYIGVYYVGAALLFFVLAGVLALLVRTQLALPLNGLLPQETYNQVFTMHGTVMMFLFAVPAVEAMAVLLLPQMLAARDLPFPRLSAYAFWAYLVGGLCFFASIFFGLAPNGGWFMYPPLTSKIYSPGINADFWLLGIGFIEISAIAGAIEIIVGVMKNRAPGMTLDKMPIFAWAMLIFAVMIVIGFPAIILGTLLLELERALDWPFFDPTRGGDPVLWQHLFWFFGHPEVYIIFLPAAGIMSMVIPATARTPLVGYTLIVLAMVATGFISFGVWAHHMFTTGMPQAANTFFSAASILVSIPAGVQVFAWIATVAAGKPRFNAVGLFSLGALVIFTMGGLTGVMVAMVPFDWQAHDTYFIVAHLHYVLIGGMVFPFFAGLYYWIPMMSRRALSEGLGRWVFGLMFVGVHVAFLPMHLTGLMGMPRRVYTYLPGRGWELPNLISTVGAFLLAVGILLFVIDLIRNFRFSADETAGNVHDAGTLEWLPTGLYSSRSIPVVTGRYPLWEDPKLARDVEAGRYFLPGAPTGGRETLVTSPLNAEPQYLQRMPEPSAWPVLAAVFTAAFFILLTIQAYVASIVGGVLAVVCVLVWLWQTDRPLPEADVDIGAGIRAPTYASGPSSPAWWAMATLLVVIGMIFLMAVFSYLFLWGRNPELWIGPPPTPSLMVAAGGWAVMGGLGWAAVRTVGIPGLGPLLGVGAILAATGIGAVAGWIDWRSWADVGLDPAATSQGATVYALIAFQGVLFAIVGLMAGYAAARLITGQVSSERRTTIEVIGLFIAYCGAQGLIGTLLVRLLPGAA
ncbi:MAG: cbb3-type cytochrome c oxidase subunit I [Phenylobacterium sp.]|nr:cbb3-type cytochrome c oxidase subunit I [Phenylobacterium sp.]